MRTPLVLAATLAALATLTIGGTGRAAPFLPLDAGSQNGSHVALFAYAVDQSGMATPLGTCEAVAAADRAACRKLEASIADARRTAALAEMAKGFDGAKLGAFARLVAAEDAFARGMAADEVDASGDRVAVERNEKEDFVRRLRVFVQRGATTPVASLAALDDALNDAYGRVMATRASDAWGGIDKAGIRRTERAWLGYRDAFTAFATALHGRDAATGIEGELTRSRTASLETFLED